MTKFLKPFFIMFNIRKSKKLLKNKSFSNWVQTFGLNAK